MENEKTELTGKDGWEYLKKVAWPMMMYNATILKKIQNTAKRAGYDPALLPNDFDSLYEFFGVDRDGSAKELTREADLYFARYAADRGRNGSTKTGNRNKGGGRIPSRTVIERNREMQNMMKKRFTPAKIAEIIGKRYAPLSTDTIERYRRKWKKCGLI